MRSIAVLWWPLSRTGLQPLDGPVITGSQKRKGSLMGQYNLYFTVEWIETQNEGRLGQDIRPLAQQCFHRDLVWQWAACFLVWLTDGGQEHVSHKEWAELVVTDRAGAVFTPPALKCNLRRDLCWGLRIRWVNHLHMFCFWDSGRNTRPEDFHAFPFDFEPNVKSHTLGQQVVPDEGEWSGQAWHLLTLASCLPVGLSEFQGEAPIQAASETNLAPNISCWAYFVSSVVFLITNCGSSPSCLGNFAFPSTTLKEEADNRIIFIFQMRKLRLEGDYCS